MKNAWKVLCSSIGQKYVVGITGLLLIGFVISHLAGNLLIYKGMGAYDSYAHALHSNPLLPIVEIVLLILFALHIAMAISVSRKNRAARDMSYGMHRSKQGKSSVTAAAVMLLSGIIILGFILLHLADLRFNLRHQVSENIAPSLHTVLVLQDPVSASVYFLGSLFLGYHLFHAFQSAFQTLGLNHPRYTPKIKKIGIGLAIILGLGFASFPIYGMLLKIGVLS